MPQNLTKFYRVLVVFAIFLYTLTISTIKVLAAEVYLTDAPDFSLRICQSTDGSVKYYPNNWDKLYIGIDQENCVSHTLINFDIKQIPSTAKITKAVINLDLMEIDKIEDGAGVGGIKPYFSAQSWTEPPASNIVKAVTSFNDISKDTATGLVVGCCGPSNKATFDVTSFIQDYISGKKPYYGFRFSYTGTAKRVYKFASKEISPKYYLNDHYLQKPVMYIQYELPLKLNTTTVTKATLPAITNTTGQFAATDRVIVDTTSPVINSVSVSAGSSTALIKWSTNEGTTALIKYGDTARYTNELKSSSLTREHEMQIQNLNALKTYHYMIEATDSWGNKSSTKDATFITNPLRSNPTLNASPIDETNVSVTSTDTVSNSASGDSQNTNVIPSDSTSNNDDTFQPGASLMKTMDGAPTELSTNTDQNNVEYIENPTEVNQSPQVKEIAPTIAISDSTIKFTVITIAVTVLAVALIKKLL